MAKIETSAAFIGATTDPNIITLTVEDATNQVKNYWGRSLRNRERLFPITYAQLRTLFAASPTREVALRVTDIDNSTIMDASWISYDSGNNAALTAAGVEPNVSYFVWREAFFEYPISVDLDPLHSRGNSHNTIICARLARQNHNSGNFYVIFQMTRIRFLGLGTGGDGDTAGLKIPSH